MAKWQRFGDDTWVNVDQVEVLRIEEDEDGRSQLIAAFSSGRTYAVGSHEDRQLLADCTDLLVRDEVSDRLRTWAGEAEAEEEPAEEEPAPVETVDEAPEPVNEPAAQPVTEPAKGRWWPFRRFSPKATPAR